MRLFVALVPPAPAVTALADDVAPVRERFPALRWTPPQRWHLTLAFLGEVEDRRLPELSERLARAAARHPAHALALAGAGRFGSQVLWAGVRGDVGATSRLAASCAAAGRRTGLVVDDRPYRPHLTLARGRGQRRRGERGEAQDLRPVVAALAGHEGPAWTAAAVRLVRSRLGPEPVYETLLTTPLSA